MNSYNQQATMSEPLDLDFTDRRHDEHPCGHREQCPLLDDAAVELIAEKAANRAIEKMTQNIYQEVGKSVISKLFYVAGALLIGAYFWAQSKGYIK